MTDDMNCQSVMSEQSPGENGPGVSQPLKSAAGFITRFLVLLPVATCILTIFFCPIRKPQVVFNMTQGTVLGSIPSVMVVPSFGLPNQTFLYSIVIHPWSDAQFFEYVSRRLSEDLTNVNEWSFAWVYWLLVDLLPGLLLVSGLLWFQSKRTAARKNAAV